MSAPILFCHFGYSNYLPFVLQAARRANPDKEVVLLGDERNVQLARECAVTHAFFRDYANGEEIDAFHACYRLIQGKDHRAFKSGVDWVKFVFLRWFYIYNYLRAQQIQSFWHFDSDTMIVEPLAPQEGKFQPYACTEQCNGICLMGWVSGPAVVGNYLRKINELFHREPYLAAQQREFDEQSPGYAFTEMRAFMAFRDEERPPTVRLNRIVDGVSFDDYIVVEHGLEMERLPNGKPVKRVGLSSDGRFYCRDLATGAAVRMISFNMSWAPFYLYPLILQHMSGQRGELAALADFDRLPTLCSQIPRRYRASAAIKRMGRAVPRFFRGRAAAAT
ncbi:MAG TPA: hypothetical protein VFE24_11550 [Pirellulales bacterium]|jgi:hypothetical protein|nr:hypothetical protein [Pirellulales bacterium]